MDEYKVAYFMERVKLIINLLLTILVWIFFAQIFLKGNVSTEKYVELYSLNYDNEYIEGRFCYGRCYIETKEYYVAYKINADGGLQLYKMDADITTIYMDADNVVYSIEKGKKFTGISSIELHIPESAISQDYNLNLD